MVCLFLIYIFIVISIPIICYNKEILYEIKLYFAKKNFEKYVHDKDWRIRAKVAEYCDEKYLDILVNDKDYNVRYEVAKRGFDEHLDILIYDRSCSVRCAVVQQGRDKDLDILINDENYNVREAVAKHGRDKDLDILVYDNDSRVRGAVADQGRRDSRLKYFFKMNSKSYWIFRSIHLLDFFIVHNINGSYIKINFDRKQNLDDSQIDDVYFVEIRTKTRNLNLDEYYKIIDVMNSYFDKDFRKNKFILTNIEGDEYVFFENKT